MRAFSLYFTQEPDVDRTSVETAPPPLRLPAVGSSPAAASFGLPAKPSEIESKELHKSKLEDKKALIKRIVQNRKEPGQGAAQGRGTTGRRTGFVSQCPFL